MNQIVNNFNEQNLKIITSFQAQLKKHIYGITYEYPKRITIDHNKIMEEARSYFERSTTKELLQPLKI